MTVRFEWLLAGGVAGTRRNGRDRNSTSRRHRAWNAGREFARTGFLQHRASTRICDTPGQHRLHPANRQQESCRQLQAVKVRS